MRSSIIRAFSLMISIVGVSVTAQAELPAFVENNQSKEELVTIQNFQEFESKIYEKYMMKIEYESVSDKNYADVSDETYEETLKELGYIDDRRKLEAHYRTLLRYSDTKELQILAMKSLLIAGVLEEESLIAIERVVLQDDVPRDLVYLIFRERSKISGVRSVNFSLLAKRKYFDFLLEDIEDGTRDTLGNAANFIAIGNEIISDLPVNTPVDYTEEIVAGMAKGYSCLKRDDKITLAYDFIGVAEMEKVKCVLDYLIVDEVLKLVPEIKKDEDLLTKVKAFSGLINVAASGGISKKSKSKIKTLMFNVEDEEVASLLMVATFKFDDNEIKARAYNTLVSSGSIFAKNKACSYFGERNDLSVISTYIEMLKPLDAKKMMSKDESGLPFWRAATPSPRMMGQINDFRGVKTVGDDFEAIRSDILKWWDKNSSDEKFYWSPDDSEK